VKLLRIAVAGLLAVGLAASANAALLVEESFEYDLGPGALVGKAGGIGWTGAWSDNTPHAPLTVGSDIVPGLTYPMLVTKGNAAYQEMGSSSPTPWARDQMRRNMSSLPDGRDELWFSQLIMITEAGLDDFTYEWMGSKYSGKHWYGRNYGSQHGDDCYWGMEMPSSRESDAAIEPGEVALLVMKVNFNGPDDVDKWLWVNPDPATLGGPDLAIATADLELLGANPNGTGFSFTRIEIDGGCESYIDEIRIGESYADVTPTPEPTTLALLGLGGIAALIRRRRKR